MARSKEIQKIVTAVDAIDDHDLIIELQEMLGIPIEGYIHEVSDEELAIIDVSRAEIASGKGVSHEQVMSNARKWVLESFGPK